MTGSSAAAEALAPQATAFSGAPEGGAGRFVSWRM